MATDVKRSVVTPFVGGLALALLLVGVGMLTLTLIDGRATDSLVTTMFINAIVVVGMPATGITGHFDPGSLAARNQRILGSKMGTSVIARDIPELVARYHRGALELDGLVSRTFALDEINEAMDEVRSGAALRNVIVFEQSEG